MLLPFFGNKSHHYLYTLLINKSVVSACAWHVDKGTIIVDALSQLIAWNEEDPNSLFDAADTAIGSLNINATQVLLSLPDDWVQGQGIHPKKKPLLRALTEKLELSSVGFVVTVEAVIAYLKESSSEPVNTICMAVESDAVIVSIISQGTPSPLVRVGRSGNAQDDFLEACSRLKLQGIPPQMRLIPLSESDTTLAQMKQELESSTWDPNLFVQLPSVAVETYAFVLSAVTQSGGREVVKAIPELTKQSESPVVPAVPFDFSPAQEHAHSNQPPVAEDQQDDVELHSTDEMSDGKKSKVPLFIGIGVVVMLVLLFGVLKIFGANLVHAEVLLVRKNQKIDTKANVIFDANPKASDSANLVHASLTPINVGGDKEVATTGKKDAGEKAKGIVTIFNKTLQSKKFPSGTTLKTGKLTFTLDADVTVASASSTISETVNGKSSAKATAVTAGETGNIDKNIQFTIGTFDSSAYMAQSETSFTGGVSRTVQAVAAKDQDAAVNALLPTLKDQAKSKFTEKLTGGQDGILLDDIRVATKKFSKAIGDEADSVSVTLTATASALLYTKNDVLVAVRPQVESSLPSGAVLSLDSLSLASGEQKKVSPTRIEQQFLITGDSIPPIDEQQYASILAGKNLEESRDFLDNQISLSSYTITFKPQFLTFFVQKLPADPAKITVNLQQ